MPTLVQHPYDIILNISAVYKHIRLNQIGNYITLEIDWLIFMFRHHY